MRRRIRLKIAPIRVEMERRFGLPDAALDATIEDEYIDESQDVSRGEEPAVDEKG